MPRDEVAVVGGGSTGSSVAFHLAKAGHGVTLFEMNQIGGGMTSLSTANVRTHYSNKTLAEMALYSLGELRKMEGAGFVNSGMLFLISKEYTEAAKANVSMLRTAGVRTEVLEPAEAARRFPEVKVDDADYLVLEPESGYADPVSTARTYASMAESAGARVHTSAFVERVESSGAPVSLQLGDGRRLGFSKVVLCTNVWTGRLLANSGVAKEDLPPIRVVPHPIIVYRRPQSYSGTRVIVSDYVHKSYYKPEGRSLLSGGSIDAALDSVSIEPEERPREVPDETVAAFSSSMMERIPAMKDATIQNSYFGLYDTTPDELPIIDELSGLGLPGVYSCVGLSGHGFKMCPAFGVMVSEMLGVDERATFERSSFGLSRFEHGAGTGTNYRGIASIV